ncbi:hypothetical protein ABW19_dt0207250 [Dactylella cylindrospora]|nr:hypothetical protein ABW19_dt0207250 [Dactylella cylindrospora]
MAAIGEDSLLQGHRQKRQQETKGKKEFVIIKRRPNDIDRRQQKQKQQRRQVAGDQSENVPAPTDTERAVTFTTLLVTETITSPFETLTEIQTLAPIPTTEAAPVPDPAASSENSDAPAPTASDMVGSEMATSMQTRTVQSNTGKALTPSTTAYQNGSPTVSSAATETATASSSGSGGFNNGALIGGIDIASGGDRGKMIPTMIL